MNGPTRIVLDTNAVIAMLAGEHATARLANEADWVGISVVTMIEFLSTPRLSVEDRTLFDSFVDRVEVIGLTADDPSLLNEIVRLRRLRVLKLPDAIVAAAALSREAAVVTRDQQFAKVDGLQVFSF